MSGTYRMIFDAIRGDFNLIRIPTIPVGGGGTTVTAGVLTLPSGAQVECNVELQVTTAGSVFIDSGSTLLVI